MQKTGNKENMQAEAASTINRSESGLSNSVYKGDLNLL